MNKQFSLGRPIVNNLSLAFNTWLHNRLRYHQHTLSHWQLANNLANLLHTGTRKIIEDENSRGHNFAVFSRSSGGSRGGAQGVKKEEMTEGKMAAMASKPPPPPAPPKCVTSRHQPHNFGKFSDGACPCTPLESCVLWMLDLQALNF